jgi:hypothetical protein
MNPKDKVFDPLLTNIATGFRPESFIAPVLLPIFKVGKQAGIYYKFNRNHLQIVDTERAAGSKTNEIPAMVWDKTTFYAEDHALKQLVTDEEVDQADGVFDPMAMGAKNVTEKLWIGAEKSLADKLRNTSIITQNTTLSGTAKWSDLDDSDPVKDVLAGQAVIEAATGQRANTIAMGRQTFDILMSNVRVLDRIKYSQLGVTSEELLKRLFQVDTLIVGRSVYNSAAPGATAVMTDIWGDDVILAYVNPNPVMKELTLGYHFQYGEHAVDKWYEKDEKGTYVRDSWYYDQEFVSTDVAYLIKDTI